MNRFIKFSAGRNLRDVIRQRCPQPLSSLQIAHTRRKFTAFLLVPILSLTAIACSRSPEPSLVEALTTGVWHAFVPNDEAVYRVTYQKGGDFVVDIQFENGVFGGRVHWVDDGKQKTELGITGVSFDDPSIEIRLEPFPPYRGEADLEAGRIEGRLVGPALYENMDLTRVDAAQWPMIRLRPPPPAGEPAAPLWTRPEERGDGWGTATPSEVGIETAAVDATMQAILAGEAGALHSFLLVRDGSLVVEEYFHGWGADDLQQFASCTKSVSSLLVGIAIDQGLIAGVDEPLLDFFPDFTGQAGQGWDALRLEHLFTMTMGLDWTDAEKGRLPPLDVDRIADIIGRNCAAEPGTHWSYADRNMSLLPGVFIKATGVETDVFAAEHLFAPLGITSWNWDDKRQDGHPDMIGSLELRPRDMAKLGQLVLDEGEWHGRRVVSEEWIRESTRTHVEETWDKDFKYGYLWWRLDSPLGVVKTAIGTGSQFIAALPEAGIVIVTTGGNQFNGLHPAILQVLERNLVPGVHTTR